MMPFDKHMNSIRRLNDSTRKFSTLKWKDNTRSYFEVVSTIHDVCNSIYQCQLDGYKREDFLEIIAPARDTLGRSPFFDRLQRWPRGYPGDYETIEYLYSANNKSPNNTIEHICELYALNSGAAQQHRNKINVQTQLISETINRNNNAKILSIAAGPCIDIRNARNCIQKSSAMIMITDTDPDAIAFSKEKIDSMIGKCSFLCGNPLKLVNKFRDLGPFDLILTGGLFDYLSEEKINLVLNYSFKYLLSNEGKMFFYKY